MSARGALATLSGSLLLPFPLIAQSQLHEIQGTTWYEGLGRSLARAGDVDGDGVTDWIAGAPAESVLTTSPGRARVYSGATYAVLHTFTGSLPDGAFGRAVAGAEDLDGDLRDDILIGVPDTPSSPGHLSGSTPGEVRGYSGASGALLFTLPGDAAGDAFGYAVASLGDLDEDGVADFAVGAPLNDRGGANAGLVRAFSGATRLALWDFVGPVAGDGVGNAIAGVGDVDGDGTGDVLVGATGSNAKGDGSGAAYLVSGADASLLRALAAGTEQDAFGTAVAGPGDLNGDGTPDLVVGAVWSDASHPSGGSVYAFSGVDGSVIWRADGRAESSGLGSATAVLGDVDGDGVNDLVAGAWTDKAQGQLYAGYVSVLAGSNGAELGRAYGEDGMRLGWAVAGLGDLDGDGRLELVAGGIDSQRNGSGIQRLFETDMPMPPSVYCTPKVNSQGCLPRISSSGAPTVSGPDDFVLQASQVINQKPGMAIWSLGAGSSWFSGGTLCLSGSVHRTTLMQSGGNVGASDCSGSFALPFTQAYMAQSGLVPGTLVHAQFWFRDPDLQFNQVGLSDALAFFVAP